MANEGGEWIMKGLEWDNPYRIRTPEELINYINQVGFLPLFANEVPGALENAKNANGFVKLTGLKVGGRTSVEACCCDACRTIMIQY